MSTVNRAGKKAAGKASRKRARSISVTPTRICFLTEEGAVEARARQEFLREFGKLNVPALIEVRIGNLLVELPVSALPQLSAVIAGRASGVSATQAPVSSALKEQAAKTGVVEKDLTTQQAATVLNVSRPFVAALADKGLLPVKMVGRNRRFRLADVLSYEKTMRKAQNAALQELADQAQELGLGY